MSACAECATAARFPHLYRANCPECCARAVLDIPQAQIREEAVRQIEAALAIPDLVRFRKAMLIAGTAT